MSDIFRTAYRTLSEEEKIKLHEIKKHAGVLHGLIVGYGSGGRETALAITKLEEAVFWVVKGLTK